MCAGGDRFHQNFRFGPLFRESYSSPALVSTNLPRGQAPEITEAPMARSFPLPRPSSRAKSRELILSAHSFFANVAVSRIPIIPYLIPSDPTSVETMGAEVDYKVAAPAELRTPNLHRAKNRFTKSADGRMATEVARF